MELTFNKRFIDQYWQMHDKDFFYFIKYVENAEHWINDDAVNTIHLMFLKESIINWNEKFFSDHYHQIISVITQIPFGSFIYLLSCLKDSSILVIYLLKSCQDENLTNPEVKNTIVNHPMWDAKIFIVRLYIIMKIKKLNLISGENNIEMIENILINYIAVLENRTNE